MMNLHFPTLGDGDIEGWLLLNSASILDFSHDIHAFDDLAENDMLVVKEWRSDGRDEELTSVGVFPGIRHAQQARSVVL